MPVGAEPAAGGGVHFRVWAPRRARVRVVLDDGADAAAYELAREAGGYFAGVVGEARVGSRYRYRLDDDGDFPDPASRFQPDGPHGPSVVVDASAYAWSDDGWRGLSLHGQVFYEMHVGTFTREETWRAAMRELPALAELGITAIEMMPVADFPGHFGWGYDGAALFAPTRLYGTPDDLRAFVDRAHALGIGVLLDVVYNHFAPDGCYLREFAEEYFSRTHRSEWGETPNFSGPDAAPVRELVLANAAYWIDEFHFDGLRLDATQSIHDDSTPHILREIGERVRAAARGRGTLVVNENEPQRASLVRPVERGGEGLDMIWNDDWHHSAIVALTGRDEAYYADYAGTPQELVSAAKHGFLFQGQWYRWQRQRRGTPSFDIEPARFVHFLENHDQVANSVGGARPRTRTSDARWRALTALLLLGPQTPMLFQGQEYGATTPFIYFADHHETLAAQVAAGRRQLMAQFESLAMADVTNAVPLPHDRATFERCKLDPGARAGHGRWLDLHRDLLRLRREDPRFAARGGTHLDGAVLGDHAFVLRYFGDDGDDRLLLVNLGRTLHLDPAPEPLLAPPAGARWMLRWSSEAPEYGGEGTIFPDAAELDRAIPGRPDTPPPHENWRLQAECALVLAPAADRLADR